MFEEVTVEYNRYTHYFDDEINPETIQGLIDVLVGIPNVDLFFCTPGGEIPSMKALIHFINNHQSHRYNQKKQDYFKMLDKILLILKEKENLKIVIIQEIIKKVGLFQMNQKILI